MIQVLVVDDDPDVRASLHEILSSSTDIDVVAEAADGRAAVTRTAAHAPDVVLLDIRMPGMDGLAAAHEIRRQHPGQLIIMLTTFGEADYVRQAVALGVNGFLLKAGDPHALLDGLRAVVAGGACLSPPIAAMLMEDHQPLAAARRDADRARTALDQLPAREREVLDLAAEGRSNAEIAAALYLSEATVKGYLSSTVTRLGVRNRVEAAILSWQAR